MSLRLILMRHAKSDWNLPAGEDFDRPLSARGRHAATKIGKWLFQNEHRPDLVLCSTATRTRETWGLVNVELQAKPRVEFSRALYLASPDVMFQAVSDIQKARCVLMISHNPGCAILANALAERAPAHARFDDYPSAAVTVFEFDVKTWNAVKPGQGQVFDFVVPRDLE